MQCKHCHKSLGKCGVEIHSKGCPSLTSQGSKERNDFISGFKHGLKNTFGPQLPSRSWWLGWARGAEACVDVTRRFN